jgi:hypothetical protein
MFHPPRIRRGAAAAIHTRRHSAARGAAAAGPHVSSAANPPWRGRGDSYQAPLCGARSGGGAFFFLFKKAVCLLNRNRNRIANIYFYKKQNSNYIYTI